MKYHITDEKEPIVVIVKSIEDAIMLNHISAKRNPQKTGREIENGICEKYQLAQSGAYLWEKMSSKSLYVSDIDGWKHISEFVGKEPCQLFFNSCDENAVYDISDGAALSVLLAETIRYEFYLTNERLSYVICFNHHDCLYGMGSAKNWIEEMRDTGEDRQV